MGTENLYEHQDAKLLRGKRCSGLRILQLFPHSFKAPTQHLFIRLLPDVHDRRKHGEQKVCILACDVEVSRYAEAVASVTKLRYLAGENRTKEMTPIDGEQTKIACRAVGPSARQQYAIPGADMCRVLRSIVLHSIYGQPPFSRDDREELDSARRPKRY